MWLFTRYGFFSVACASTETGSLDPQKMMIRARKKGHLQKLQSRFPAIAASEIVTLEHHDYRYRLLVPKAVWVALVAEMAGEQDWSNFKHEAARFQGPTGSDYVRALHDVWEVMYGLQSAGR